MEQVGDGDIDTNVDMAGSIVNAFKDGGNSVGDVHTDIALMHDQGENALRPTCGVTTIGNPRSQATKTAPTHQYLI